MDDIPANVGANVDGGSDDLAQTTQDLARLLQRLADGRREGREALSLARLAKRSALPMSTLLRYLSVLTDAGWVALDDGERGLSLARLTPAGAAQLDSLRNTGATDATVGNDVGR
ncbi:transcriptional regulator [Pandoraea captiosa]|uniref:Transcriptional regulator n=1 Tax=Pandoraea captiosa TaxID=2508302 RepID=A0A5E4ZMZ5_9BURK|nr:helix-turn-helix domain-containing protein [Pandoraea captiosa]VVE62544.1 transcriptional regulator [Pandoraea captiosa]